MSESDDRAGLVQWLATGLALLVLFVLYQAIRTTGFGLAFNFRFNAFALLSLLAVLSNAVLIVLIARIRAKTHDLVWLALYVACLLMWAVVELFTRLSATGEVFLFWGPLASLPIFFAPVMLFMFVLTYIKPKQGRDIWTIVPLFVAATVMVFFDQRTTGFNNYDLAQIIPTPWNGAVMPGRYFGVVVLWIAGLTLLAAIMLVRFYHQTVEPVLRWQVRLLVLAILVPIAIGAVTDGFLPVMGNFTILPLGVVLTSVSAAFITYGVLRYRLISLNPSLVAGNILETINEAVMLVKPDMTIKYANEGAAKLFGYAEGEMAKRRFGDFLSQDWDVRTLRKILFTPAEREPHEFDSIDLRTADGKIISAKLSVSKMTDEGVSPGYLVVMTDISNLVRAAEIIEHTVNERTREVHEAKATLVTSLNSLKMGFLITNARPEVIRLNTVAHDLFCHSNTHTAGDCHAVNLEKVQDLMGHDIAIVETIRECLLRQLPHELKDVTFKNRNWRLYVSPMVVDRKSIGCAVVLQDTTDERILERSRDEFFSIASHELRTPLTSIKGNSSLILQYYQDVLKDETLKEMVTDIHESSDRLIEIVNDFLDVSRLEQGRIEFHMEQLSVSKVVEEVVYEIGALAKQKGIKLRLSHDLQRLDALPLVVADKNRLKQIFFNLIGNAIKFTKAGDRISLDATAGRDFIKVSVADTGVGISPEYQALLFHKFQQASDSILTRDASQGTGLGLYISRLLATGMGGSLELERSVLGEGSVFALKVVVATPARLRHLAKMQKVLDPQSGLMVDKA